jgi:hypothetical protein
VVEDKKKIEENKIFIHEQFVKAQQRERDTNPELKPSTASPEYQQNKKQLEDSGILQQLRQQGIADAWIEDYLLGKTTIDIAQRKGISLSIEYTENFKLFEQSLNLPDDILSFREMEKSLDIPTHTVSGFITENDASRRMFDDKMGIESVKE